jgi:hypothetical protein
MIQFSYLTITILILVISGLSIYLSVLIFGEKKVPKDSPIIINLESKYSNGRAIGIVTDVESCSLTRKKYKYSPKDVDITKTEEPKEEFIIVDPEKLAVLQKGSLSRDKNIIINCPDNATDFDEAIRNTTFGKALMFYTELKNYEKTHIEYLKEGSKRKSDILKEIGDGEISADFMSFMINLVKDDLKATISKQKDEKKFELPSGK